MTAPDTVKPSDHPDFIGGIVWSPLELKWINRIVAEKDARIAELERDSLPCNAWDSRCTQYAKERDALKAQLADAVARAERFASQLIQAVETLKGIGEACEWNGSDWEPTLLADRATNCLKRIGVTGDKSC